MFWPWLRMDVLLAAFCSRGVWCEGHACCIVIKEGWFRYARFTPVMHVWEAYTARVLLTQVHSCAIAGTALYCWGNNSKYQVGLRFRWLCLALCAVDFVTPHARQIGDNSQTTAYTPVGVSGMNSGVVAVTAGWVCAWMRAAACVADAQISCSCLLRLKCGFDWIIIERGNIALHFVVVSGCVRCMLPIFIFP